MASKKEMFPQEPLASDVRVICGILRSKALLIAICTVGAVLVAFVYTCFLPQVYLPKPSFRSKVRSKKS